MVKRFVMLAALALALPAQAQEAVLDPDHIVGLLKDAGYPAEYFSEEAEYRQILISKPGSHQFLVELYDCEEGKTCDTLEFFAGFTMEQPPAKEALDAYPGPREGAQIYLDRRGKPTIKREIHLPAEGLTDAQFLDEVKTWESMMTQFSGFLTGKPPEAAPAAGAEATAAAAAGTAPVGEVADAT
jgi:hypothetical protein